MQGLHEGGTERVVRAWVQGGGGRGACLSLHLSMTFYFLSFSVIEGMKGWR